MHTSFNKLKQYVFRRMRSELSSDLHYHNLCHTRDQVLCDVRIISSEMAISPGEKRLVMTAALFHDTGFFFQYEENEALGAEFAQKTLPGFGYSEDEIERITQLILATALPQAPKTPIEQILCDADLASVGKDIFIASSLELWREMCHFKGYTPLAGWLKSQYVFLRNHSFFTNAAQKLYDRRKRENRQFLQLLVRNR